MTISLDRRSHDLITVPRSAAAEAWMDVRASAGEVRNQLGHALIEKVNGRDPWPRIYEADRRLGYLEAYARRKAGEAEGLIFLPVPGQLPLPDSCFDDKSTA